MKELEKAPVYEGNYLGTFGDTFFAQLMYYNIDGEQDHDNLHDVINDQNERITALEAQVAGLVAKSVNKFGEELL